MSLAERVFASVLVRIFVVLAALAVVAVIAVVGSSTSSAYEPMRVGPNYPHASVSPSPAR